MMPTAKRVVTWRTEHSTRTLVDRLDFVTASGNLTTLITAIAVFQREPARGSRFALESWHPQVTPDEVARRTGFRFNADHAVPTPAPTAAECAALDGLDPHGEFAAAAAR